jgi:hypothetical protein
MSCSEEKGCAFSLMGVFGTVARDATESQNLTANSGRTKSEKTGSGTGERIRPFVVWVGKWFGFGNTNCRKIPRRLWAELLKSCRLPPPERNVQDETALPRPILMSGRSVRTPLGSLPNDCRSGASSGDERTRLASLEMFQGLDLSYLRGCSFSSAWNRRSSSSSRSAACCF